MAERASIFNFAIKWIRIFQNPMTTENEVNDAFPGDCFSLGFELKVEELISGYLIRKESLKDYIILYETIRGISDPSAIGTIVFSMWKYLSQWPGAALLEPANRVWFLTALGRLEEICSETGLNPFVFHGNPSEVTIVSNIITEEEPAHGKEVEQWLTLSEDGEIQFESYNYDTVEKGLTPNRIESLKIDPRKAKDILMFLTSHYKTDYRVEVLDRASFWFMSLKNHRGDIFQYSGFLFQEDQFREEASKKLRKAITIEGLFLFDGKVHQTDQIIKISVEYESRIIGDHFISDKDSYYSSFSPYKEILIIDRESQTLKHTQDIQNTGSITKEYHLEGGISNLLDQWDYSFFDGIDGNPEDTTEDKDLLREFEITIDFYKRPQHKIIGTYDKNSLPRKWEEFLDEILVFMYSLGWGDLFNPKLYGKAKRRKSDLIYVSVDFSDSGKSYYYRTEDDSVSEGDYVLVQVGNQGHFAMRKVIDVEYFQEKDVPYPFHKTKKILRKCTEEDIINFGTEEEE